MKFFGFGQKQSYTMGEAVSLINKQLDETQNKNKSQLLSAAERARAEFKQLRSIIGQFASKDVPEVAKRSGNVKERFCSVALRQLDAEMPQDAALFIQAAGSMLNTLGGLTQRQMLHINVFFRDDFTPIARKMKEIEQILVFNQSGSEHRRASMLHQKLGLLEAKSKEAAAPISRLEERKTNLSQQLDEEQGKTYQEPDDEQLRESRKIMEEARQDIDSFLPVQKLLKKYVYARQIKDRLIEAYISSPSSAILQDSELKIIDYVSNASGMFSELNENKRNSILNGKAFLMEKSMALQEAIKRNGEEAAKYQEEKDRYARLLSEKQRRISSLETGMKEATKQLDETKLERKELQEDAIKTRDEFCALASKLLNGVVK